MTIRSPERWLEITQHLAEVGQRDTREIAAEFGMNVQAAANTCGAMARHGYLVLVGVVRRKHLPNGKTLGPYLIYDVTPEGRELELPPPRDPRSPKPSAGNGRGKCLLAEVMGLVRR